MGLGLDQIPNYIYILKNINLKLHYNLKKKLLIIKIK
jgi:hypothetical protein